MESDIDEDFDFGLIDIDQDMPPFMDDDFFNMLDMLMMMPPPMFLEPGFDNDFSPDWEMVKEEEDLSSPPDMLMLPNFFSFPGFPEDLENGNHTSQTWKSPDGNGIMHMETYSFCNDKRP